MQNPMTAYAGNAGSKARRHFADHCASCHGNDGRGATEMGRNMYPPAPDMTLADHPKPDRRRAVLHYRKRSALYGNAGLGRRRAQRSRYLESGAVHSPSAASVAAGIVGYGKQQSAKSNGNERRRAGKRISEWPVEIENRRATIVPERTTMKKQFSIAIVFPDARGGAGRARNLHARDGHGDQNHGRREMTVETTDKQITVVKIAPNTSFLKNGDGGNAEGFEGGRSRGDSRQADWARSGGARSSLRKSRADGRRRALVSVAAV